MKCRTLGEEGQSEEEAEEEDIHREGEYGPEGLFVEEGEHDHTLGSA